MNYKYILIAACGAGITLAAFAMNKSPSEDNTLQQELASLTDLPSQFGAGTLIVDSAYIENDTLHYNLVMPAPYSEEFLKYAKLIKEELLTETDCQIGRIALFQNIADGYRYKVNLVSKDNVTALSFDTPNKSCNR